MNDIGKGYERIKLLALNNHLNNQRCSTSSVTLLLQSKTALQTSSLGLCLSTQKGELDRHNVCNAKHNGHLIYS